MAARELFTVGSGARAVSMRDQDDPEAGMLTTDPAYFKRLCDVLYGRICIVCGYRHYGEMDHVLQEPTKGSSYCGGVLSQSKGCKTEGAG